MEPMKVLPKAKALIFNALLILVSSAGLLEAAKTYSNPVISEIGPADPTAIFYEGKYYLYPTGDNRSYHVYTSDDLVNWTKGPKVFSPGGVNVWAPDVFYNRSDGKFYLYYTANWKIGFAVGDKPDGTFKDKGIFIKGAIDSHMFQDGDGRYYLYFVKRNFEIHVQQMSTPLQLTSNSKMILKPTEPWERTVTEGPWMIKHGDLYYLLYSGYGANTKHYAVGYATANNPVGPFTKYPGNPIIKGSEELHGPGHGSVTQDSAGNLWHVYHQKRGPAVGWDRFICIDPLWFDPNGVLHGKATRGNPQQAPIIKTKPKPP
jgi:xylan 1,4-beta-xylosidase